MCRFPAAMLVFGPPYCRCHMTTSGAARARYDVTLFWIGSPIQPKYKTLTRQKTGKITVLYTLIFKFFWKTNWKTEDFAPKIS
jgi:hypothetical protein